MAQSRPQQLTWLGHSAFHLRLASGEVILFDPWLSNPSAPADFPLDRCDAILLSHGHSDHIGNTLELAARFKPKVVGIYEVYLWLAARGLELGIGMNKGGTLDLGFARVTMTMAFHSSNFADNGEIVYGGEPSGFVVEAEGRRYYFAGDTCVFGDMRLINEIHGPFDVAMLPIGDLYTMGPKEASFACRLLRPKTVVPMHWGTFPALTGTPQALADLTRDLPAVHIANIQPGQTLMF